MSGLRGSTLIEAVASMMIVAMMTAPIMATVLSASISSQSSSRRSAAADAARGLSEHLKAYVTADASLVAGPGAGADGWSLAGDASGLAAFAAGHHALEAAIWAPALRDCGGQISYDVSVRDTPAGREPDVTFNVSWNDE